MEKEVIKESKFEKYLLLKEEEEKLDLIVEKLGSLDAMDASELGLPANVPLKFADIEKAFKKFDGDVNQFLGKVKSVFKGITPNELEHLSMALKTPRSDGGNIFTKNTQRSSEFK